MGFFFILIPIVSLIFISGTKMEYVIPPYEKMANQITAETADRIRTQFNLDPVGSGGAMMHDVKVMALSFNCYRPLSIDESRELVINCVNEYLKSVNENKEIRPYLHNFPFNEQNIELVIFIFEDNKFTKIQSGQVSSVSTLNGKIRYKTRSAEDQYKREILHQETYEEALRILKEQSAREMSP
ncbi:MAG: hypothetical protein KDK56_06565 [Simkania sp.]|nr:hypothetical protein [Simkania sp.]